MKDAALSVYMANRILIEGNHIESGTNTGQRSARLRIYQSDSVVFSNNTIYSVIDGAMVKRNEYPDPAQSIQRFQQRIWVQEGKLESTAITLFKKDIQSLGLRIRSVSLEMQRLSFGIIALALPKLRRIQQHDRAIKSKTIPFEESSLYVVMY
ncbi:hypothetical protein ACEQPO_02760 [Bacillus sp. SL00103]